MAETASHLRVSHRVITLQARCGPLQARKGVGVAARLRVVPSAYACALQKYCQRSAALQVAVLSGRGPVAAKGGSFLWGVLTRALCPASPPKQGGQGGYTQGDLSCPASPPTQGIGGYWQQGFASHQISHYKKQWKTSSKQQHTASPLSRMLEHSPNTIGLCNYLGSQHDVITLR